MNVLESDHYLIHAALPDGAAPDGYPFDLPAVRDLKNLEFHPKVTFLIGENGTGKSTILEALAAAMRFNPEGGSKNFHFATNNTHSALYDHLKIIKGIRQPKDGYFLRAESFYNVATNIEDLDRGHPGPSLVHSYGGKSLHTQSHGESFMALMQHRFRGNGLYFLDEPEAALSVRRQMELLALIQKLTTKQSQFVIATHSPIILSYPDAVIYEASENGLQNVSYEETEQYQLTKYFLDNKEKLLDELLAR